MYQAYHTLDNPCYTYIKRKDNKGDKKMNRYITGTDGQQIQYDGAVQLMDDTLRELCHSIFEPASTNEDEANQQFFDLYAAMHYAKYNTRYLIN